MAHSPDEMKQDPTGLLERVGGRRPVIVAVSIVVVVGVVTWLVRDAYRHDNHSSTIKIAQDAGTLVGTFITLYTLFLGGFAGLAGIVVTGGARPRAKTVAVVLIIAATLVDFWRIVDATGDLFTSSNRGLTAHDVRDIANDFRIFFVINAAVVVFGILVACLKKPAEASDSEDYAVLTSNRSRSG
jgi:hypothetical protein